MDSIITRPKRDMRATGLIVATALMFLTNLIFFQKLWMAERDFPKVPIFRFLSATPGWVTGTILFSNSVCAFTCDDSPAEGRKIYLAFYPYVLHVLVSGRTKASATIVFRARVFISTRRGK